MATAPNLVVAGDPVVARKLRETARFPAVFMAASATELRELSRSGQVTPPAAFMFAPGFSEDVPGAGVAELANKLAGNGFTVLVHGSYPARGDVFSASVQVTGPRLVLSELLATLGAGAAPPTVPRTDPPDAPKATPQPTPQDVPQANPWAVPGDVVGADPWVAARPAAGGPRGRVIAVASAKGGVGKTSTTVNLSVFAARVLQAAGRPGAVVVVDTNFQQADVARYLDLEWPTILDLFQTPGGLTAGTIRNHLARVPEIGLHALLGPPDAITADPALINSMLYQRILKVLRETFDYVFIDTPVAELYHTTFTDLVLPEADAILVPVEPNRVTLAAARSWLQAITLPRHASGGGVDPEKLSLLLNRARMDVDCGPEEVMNLMPGWRFVGMIPENEGWMQSVNTHRLLAMEAGPALDATFRGILGVLTQDPVFTSEAGDRAAPGPARRWKRLLGLNPA